MEKTVIFRVDGGNIYSVAMGHVFKCVRIARFLREKNVKCLFVMKNYPEGVNIVNSYGFEVKLLDKVISIHEEKKKVVSLSNDSNALLYVDLRNNKKDIIEFANRKGITTVVYEDVNIEDIEPTLLINPSMSCIIENIYHPPKKNTRYLLGTEYVVLDPLLNAYKRKIFSPVIQDLFTCFGGADPGNMSSIILNVLLTGNDTFNIILALGPAFMHYDEIYKILAEKDERKRVTLITDCKDLAPIQTECDAAITSGGTITYESIALRIPTLVIPSIDSEARNIAPLIDKGLIMGIKKDIACIDNEELSEVIDKFVRDIKARQRLYENSSFCDLMEGISRVVDQVYNLLN